jgi:hypothetical protein
MPYIVNRYPNGLVLVHFEDEIVLISSSADYHGETGAGLRSGDSAEAAMDKYGTPDGKSMVGNRSVWLYSSPGIAFRIRDDRVLSWLVFLKNHSQ